MKSEPEKKSVKEKIKIFFTSLCAKPSPPEIETEKPEKKQVHSKIVKRERRQTIKLDDIFTKHSRKNIVEEEFFTDDILNLQMQHHLFSRIRGAFNGLIKGEFSTQVLQGIQFPIHFQYKPLKNTPEREQVQTILPLGVRPNCIDLVLYQTSATIQKSSKNNNTQQIRQEQTHQILVMLKTYLKSVPNIVLICSSNCDFRSLYPILRQNSGKYLYELENIRKNQELVCNVIYISGNPQFLKLNDKCFVDQFMMRLNLKVEEEEKARKILTDITAKRYHRKIVRIVWELNGNMSLRGKSFFDEFIWKLKKDGELREFVEENNEFFKMEEIKQEKYEFYEETPNFGNTIE